MAHRSWTWRGGSGLVAALLLLSCGPGALSPADAAIQDVLVSSSDYLELTPPARRAQLFAELGAQADSQAREQAIDSPALVALERQGNLIAVPLPAAGQLLDGGQASVDVETSSDPWPIDPRESLGGQSERERALAVGSALAALLGADGQVVIQRAAGAPYAAALLLGELRLNPALLYLASAAAPEPKPRPLASPSDAGVSCASASGAAFAWLIPLLAWPLRRRAIGA